MILATERGAKFLTWPSVSTIHREAARTERQAWPRYFPPRALWHTATAENIDFVLCDYTLCKERLIVLGVHWHDIYILLMLSVHWFMA